VRRRKVLRRKRLGIDGERAAEAAKFRAAEKYSPPAVRPERIADNVDQLDAHPRQTETFKVDGLSLTPMLGPRCWEVGCDIRVFAAREPSAHRLIPLGILRVSATFGVARRCHFTFARSTSKRIEPVHERSVHGVGIQSAGTARICGASPRFEVA
jgi:hypothetical protein